MLRVMVFIDLQELEAGLRGLEVGPGGAKTGRASLDAGEFEVDGESLSRWLAEDAAGRALGVPVARLRLAGVYIYASLDPRNPRDRKLKDWATKEFGSGRARRRESGPSGPRGDANSTWCCWNEHRGPATASRAILRGPRDVTTAGRIPAALWPVECARPSRPTCSGWSAKTRSMWPCSCRRTLGSFPSSGSCGGGASR